jgi:hypothetical protein
MLDTLRMSITRGKLYEEVWAELRWHRRGFVRSAIQATSTHACRGQDGLVKRRCALDDVLRECLVLRDWRQQR